MQAEQARTPVNTPLADRPAFQLDVHENERILINRVRRQVAVPMHSLAHRTRRFYGCVLADTAVLLAVLYGWSLIAFGLPNEVSAEFAVQMGLPILFVYLSGGYWEELCSKHPQSWAPPALLAGLAFALGYLVLKTGQTKMGATLLVPDAVDSIKAGGMFALWVALSRVALGLNTETSSKSARIIFVGPTSSGRRLARIFRERGRLDPIVNVDPERGDGSIDNLLRGRVRAIVLGVPLEALTAELASDVVHARFLNVPVLPPALLLESIFQRTPVTLQDPSWFLEQNFTISHRAVYYSASKRILDIVAASCGIILGFPVFVVVAIAIKATSQGPVLFRQERVGKWKAPFTIYKFRTMHENAESAGATWASDNDPRVTSIGGFLRKTRLDELPQLFNVLMGQMSLIGPRPERPEFTSQLEAQIPYYDLRHIVKPGLTGWAQVNYKYGSSVEDAIVKLEYEVFYIKRSSILFDLAIAARTVGLVLRLRGT